ncbi:MAG: acyl carrier protein [Firmicutes bacterium]|nr:acyl carrier protein [Bacillota bacterium]
MTNKEKYDYAFTSNFRVSQDDLPGLKYQEIFEWDSVGHMDLIADIESAYGIQMDTKDVLDLSSYEKGFKILSELYGVNFDE